MGTRTIWRAPGYQAWPLVICPSNVQTWKYVDDTTLAEVIPKDGESSIQEAVDTVALWSRCNKLQLKCGQMQRAENRL